MKKVTSRLILSLIAFLFGNFAWGQNLTPNELLQINSNPDFTFITSTLVEKGFKLASHQTDEKTKDEESAWYFQPFTHPGEDVSAYLIKSIDSNQNSKTTFFLYNPFHYKDFIYSLTKSKYMCKGIQVIDSKSYTVFKNKRTILTTREMETKDNQICFEITMRTE